MPVDHAAPPGILKIPDRVKLEMNKASPVRSGPVRSGPVTVLGMEQDPRTGQRLWDFSLPAGLIGLSLFGITIAAVLAAMWPARRAARTNLLAAIASE
ncbi:hypothetical protein DDE74_35145 [Streptomyces lydicus]|uniref:Uncharacterized protein n=2 Tax=Streptomyces lydicus TaxID=47763 RepID=A0A3S9YKE7_9ACTN|nr:hypothetical protein DDE74_35145 [Streptomyces lydicus]